MDYPSLFARHFSRLVWLLLHEPASTDEQKAALRALVIVSRDGPVHLVRRDGRIAANTIRIPEALPGVSDLLERMGAHDVDEILVEVGAAPADLLALARALAAVRAPGAGAAGLRLDTIRVLARGGDPRASVTSPATSPAAAASALGAVAVVNLSDGLGMDLELVDPAEAQAALADRHAVAEPKPTPVPTPSSGTDAAAAFANLLREGDAQAILAGLDVATSMHRRGAMLEEIASLVERSARDGKAMLAADLIGGVVRREAAAPEDSEERRMLGRVARRVLKGGVLRQVAMLLPRKRGRIDEYEAVLMRAGEDGADALIEQLTQATTAEDRRTFFNLLVRMRAGVGALVHMLGDHRWYVARNAADLLGEMEAVEGEAGLIPLLRHADERVRRAASTALVRIGTPRGVQAVHEAMKQAKPELRVLAASALGGRKNQAAAATLVRAFDEEEDEEVQLAIIAALGKVATPDAVGRLAQAAEPGGRLFRKKSTVVRLAAVHALAEARTAAALGALRGLADDRDREVREAATRALGKG